jgi:peptidoglycan-N-acetylglucosamine deacetylase
MHHRHAIVIAVATLALICGGAAAAANLTGSQAGAPVPAGTGVPTGAVHDASASVGPLAPSPHPSPTVISRRRTISLATVVRRVEGAGRRVALTFDDGDPVWWRRVLRILRKSGVHATFFILGGYVDANPDLARRTLADGHAIGSHGCSHAVMTGETAMRVRVELARSCRVWRLATGTTPRPYLRPPYGMYDRETRRVAAAVGFTRFILWDVDPEDWRDPGARVIARRVLRDVRPGSIVLMHLKAQTAWALPSILRGLRARGLRPVTVPQLLRAGAG